MKKQLFLVFVIFSTKVYPGEYENSSTASSSQSSKAAYQPDCCMGIRDSECCTDCRNNCCAGWCTSDAACYAQLCPSLAPCLPCCLSTLDDARIPQME